MVLFVQTPDSWQPWLEMLTRAPAAVWIFLAAMFGYGIWRGSGWWQRGSGERALKRRQRIAEQAEIDAAGVLRSAGYHILDAQVEHHWTILLDGEAHSVELRADYLVSRGPKRFVAEVKSGRSAPSISTAATRRQLLEYRVAYPVDGILLVDMEAVEIHVVDFGDRIEQRPRRARALATLLFGALLGAGVALGAARFGLF